MRIFKIIPLVAALLAFVGLGASAQNVALVLSNGNYENAVDVDNISRRHQQLVRAFQAQGYEVIEGQDLTRLETRRTISAFADALEGAEIAVISLQGHVVHFGETSWFLPADINANSVTGVEFRAVSLDFFAQLLGQKPGRSVLFVGESGRMPAEVPLLKQGLARMNLPRGVMMVSGAYNEVKNIIENRFMRRNTKVLDVLRGDIGALEVEGDIPAALVLADGRGPVVSGAEAREAALGLNQSERRAIQRDLTALGYDTRGIDGLFGNGTRGSIRDWQRRERLDVTGYLTEEQIRLLRRQAGEAREVNEANDRRFWAQTGAGGSERGLRRYLDRYPNGVFSNRARADLARLTAVNDEQAWARAVRIDTPESYRRYLHDYPNGIYKDIARERIDTPPEVVESDASRVERALRLNPVTRLLIEQRVADLGYRTGPRDGNFDLATRQGFRSYQRDRGLPVTGYVTAEMIRRLLLGQ